MNPIKPIPSIGSKGGHIHDVPSQWNPLKERSVVLTDHATGAKSSYQYEDIDLPEGTIRIRKKNGIVYG